MMDRFSMNAYTYLPSPDNIAEYFFGTCCYKIGKKKNVKKKKKNKQTVEPTVENLKQGIYCQ